MSDDTLDPDISTAVGGLTYIASSPAPEHGGFHPNTVAIAKLGLERIAELEAEVARLRADIMRPREWGGEGHST